MGMRKYERAVAKYRLESLGYTNLNRKRSDTDGKPVPSGFAQTWRKILTPGTQHHKEWVKHWVHMQRLMRMERLSQVKGEA